jgi:hypothetical protein
MQTTDTHTDIQASIYIDATPQKSRKQENTFTQAQASIHTYTHVYAGMHTGTGAHAPMGIDVGGHECALGQQAPAVLRAPRLLSQFSRIPTHQRRQPIQG